MASLGNGTENARQDLDSLCYAISEQNKNLEYFPNLSKMLCTCFSEIVSVSTSSRLQYAQ